jgi:hypothetical protein
MILREKDCPGGQSFLWVSCTSVTFWNKLLKNVVKRGKIQYDPKRQLKSGYRTIEERCYTGDCYTRTVPDVRPK